MKNKKGLTMLANIILVFAVFSVMFIFSSVLIFETGEDYFIAETADSGREIAGTLSESVNASVSAKIDELQNDYSNFLFPYDLFFLLMWFSFFGTTVISAFQFQKDGVFSFFGLLFFGSMLLLLITTYMSDFTTWFMTEIFDKVFSDSTISMPILNFYLANLGLINFIWWVILLLIAIIDKSFISKTGEVQP